MAQILDNDKKSAELSCLKKTIEYIQTKSNQRVAKYINSVIEPTTEDVKNFINKLNTTANAFEYKRFVEGFMTESKSVLLFEPANIEESIRKQVLAYMFRFDTKKGYYLYPEVGLESDLHLRLNRGVSFEKNVVPRDDISVIKHGLKIPNDVENYAEFCEMMDVAEKEFVSGM